MLMGYFVHVIQEHREACFERLLRVLTFTSDILRIVGGLNTLFHTL